MPYSIERKPDLVEVQIHNQATLQDILGAVEQVVKADPRKEICDLWVVPEEVSIPFEAFSKITELIKSFCGPDWVGNRSAMVAAGTFQMAQMELFQMEAASLPFEIGIFLSREEA